MHNLLICRANNNVCTQHIIMYTKNLKNDSISDLLSPLKKIEKKKLNEKKKKNAKYFHISTINVKKKKKKEIIFKKRSNLYLNFHFQTFISYLVLLFISFIFG